MSNWDKLTALPENTRVHLSHDSERQSRYAYGPDGNEKDGNGPVRKWHCNIEPQKECGSCGYVRSLGFPRGHGFTADEAITEALHNYESYMAALESSNV